MNVGPAQLSPVETDVREFAGAVRSAQAPGPGSGNARVREVPIPRDSPPVSSIAQDEVKLQWDSSDQVMIYQFVNQKSGALILQVPSEEVLNLARGIQESLQKESLQRQALQEEILQQPAAPLAAAGTEGGKSNGS